MAAAVDMSNMLSLQTQQSQQFEDNMDTFFDFNQGEFHSPASQTPDHNKASLDSSVPVQQSEYVEHPQRHYNGPSHEYDRFRQQTGLPTGAVSHMAAINGYSAPSQPSESFSQYSMGYNSGVDFDGMAYAGDNMSSQGMPAYFYPNDTNMDEFVDPSAVDAQSQPAPQAVRLRPGMHSQQAQHLAQQKQQNAQQQQQQQHNNTAQKQQQQSGMAAQRPLPQMQQQQQKQQQQQQQQQPQKRVEEPQLNSQISRLLNQMRQGSVGSSQSDGSPEADGNEGIPTVPKPRKDEDDMDEDERLLASEEGKKLSSKERRQLRNKVSARAFRSRRKEYISQLEGEVAARTEEASSLRSRNNHLYVQNQQLLQLTQAMLNHPAFGNFMQDLSRNPNMLQQQAQQVQQQQQQQKQSKQSVKEELTQNNNNNNNNNEVIVGMTRIPEPNLDFSMLNLGANDGMNNSYGQPSQSFGDFQNPQVFAVHSIPEGPSPEELLAERRSRKPEMPLIPELPRLGDKDAETTPFKASTLVEAAKPAQDAAETEDDPAFALYRNAPAKMTPTATCSPKLPDLSALSTKTRFTLAVKKDDATLSQELDALLAPAEETLRVLSCLI